MRVILFGNDYNRLALACLEAMRRERRYTLAVGVCVPQSSGLLATARRSFRERGLRFVLRKGLALVGARAGGLVRSLSGRRTGFRSLREAARALDVPCVDVSRLKDETTIEAVAALAPDVIVVAGFSRILRADVIGIPTRGCINVHPSLLPRYRGPNPIYWVLANGEAVTGTSVHYVDEGIDTGDVIAQREIPILDDDDERSLFTRCIRESAALLTEVLPAFEDGPAPATPQEAEHASYYPQPPKGASIL